MFGGSVSAFVIGIVAGLIGFALFLYGRKTQAMRPMLIGIALMAYPYFVSGALWSALIGLGLIALLWRPR